MDEARYQVLKTEISGLRGLLILCTCVLATFGVFNSVMNIWRAYQIEVNLKARDVLIQELQKELRECPEQREK